MPNGQEKRKYKRIEKPYKAIFQIRQYKGHEMFSTSCHMVSLKDISAGGTSFNYNVNYNDNLEIDSFLNLIIALPAFTLPVNCVGKIIRIEQPQPGSWFRIATEFTEIGEQEKEMINKVAEGISE